MDGQIVDFIPKLGVEFYYSMGRFYFDKIIGGFQQEGALFGGVGFPENTDVVARGHMHWINIKASDGDLRSARAFYQARQSVGLKGYSSYVGGGEITGADFFITVKKKNKYSIKYYIYCSNE